MMGLLKEMGLRYVLFRFWYAFQKTTGILKWRFPVGGKQASTFSKSDWLQCKANFPTDYATLHIDKNLNLSALKERAEHIRNNRFLYFGHKWFNVTDWHTNPESGFVYSKTTHWSKISANAPHAGDIKYVWEKSRFCFLYDLIRFDFHYHIDQSVFVFSIISNWIEQNPVNCGPNWICGQEISLRVLNWTFALHFYKNAAGLTDELFAKIVNSIRQQMLHVQQNINFSRIAVRNNHALTETLALYVTGLCFPFFTESSRWKQKGKRWFENEIAYQIYEDGTFVQFSMIYHRVAVQLLTLAIKVSELNDEKWANVVYDRAVKSIYFLRSCQDHVTGWLPNYGNNDGALFFPLTGHHFRDFRPELEVLSGALKMDATFQPKSLSTFKNGGYYIIREENTLTFLRCGAYKDRPAQADNLHLDIWADGKNIMRDAGSYSYNTEDKWTRYFAGTSSHNTVMLGDFDQMKKGPRFIWYNWIKKAKASVSQHNDTFQINAEFEGFYQLGKGIKHCRRVTKSKKWRHWIIEDWIENGPECLPMHQIWHPCQDFFDHYCIISSDREGNVIALRETTGWHSSNYGTKEVCRRLVFSTFSGFLRTVISEK
jgi:hypothetical protein